MHLLNILVILWLVLCLAVSLILIKTIYDHIRLKAVSSVTIIDLTYSDCLICLHCFGIVYSSGIIGCLLTKTQTLDFITSLIIAEAMYISVCYILCGLTITAILRLISLVNNSEEFGIQSLGPDDAAIWKIRILSHTISFGLPFVGLIFFQSIPGFFAVLNNSNAITPSEIGKFDPYNFVYTVPVIIAATVNIIPKIYSVYLVQRLNNSTYFPTKFLFSLNNAIAFSFIISGQILSAFLSREHRLYFYYPLVVFLSCDVIPFIIIKQNPLIIKRFKELFSNSALLHFENIFKFRKVKIGIDSI